MNSTFGVALVARNDGYGGNLNERASYAINSMISTFDEIVYVDWNTVRNKTLIEEIKDNLIPTNKLTVIKVPPYLASQLTNYDANAQVCSETLGKNVGIRRLNTDFMLSTSIEDISPTRDYLDKLSSKDIFYIGARRGLPLEDIKALGNYKNFPNIQIELDKTQNKYVQVANSGAYPGDIWSIINCCGDFQFASREMWYELRGFEETLIYRGFLDTNIQKKVSLLGHKVELHREIPIFHINHTHGFGGFGGVNDMNSAIKSFTASTNKDTWGFSEQKFEMFNLMDIKKG